MVRGSNFTHSPIVDIEDGWTRRGGVVTGGNDPAHKDLLAWLTDHGLDPGTVVARGGIERDADAGVIRYDAFVCNDEGQRILSPKPEGGFVKRRAEHPCPTLASFPATIVLGPPVRPAEPMETHWTGGLVFPFVEDENCNITGAGHQDKEAFAAAVNRFDEACTGEPKGEDDLVLADHISHEWVVVDDDGERMWSAINGSPVTEHTEGAQPVTALWGQR